LQRAQGGINGLSADERLTLVGTFKVCRSSHLPADCSFLDCQISPQGVEHKIMSDMIFQNGNGHHASVAERIAETTDTRRVAMICLLYLLLLLVFFSWQLFDTWIGQHSLPRSIGYDLNRLNTAGFRLVAFTVIGGGLGGVINGIRSILNYYNGFHHHYAWKYISAPWMGATLALFVYALIHSSIVILGGSGTAENVSTAQVLSNFAAGTLAGYGSKDVFIWLDAKVHKIFQVTEKVPDVTGKPEHAAVSRLHATHLELGAISTVPQRDGKRVGTVIDQSPPPQTPLDRGESVDIAVATSSKAE
jgi:hypothetical protein